MPRHAIIRGAMLIDACGESVRGGKAVVLEDNVIIYVGDDKEDLQSYLQLADPEIHLFPNKTVMPGLINMHEHLVMKRTWGPLWRQVGLPDEVLAIRGVRAALADIRAGITTVRDLGAKNLVDLSLRYAVECGIIPGPRIIAAGTPLSITGGHARHLGLEVDGIENVRKAVRKLVKEGVDWVKLIGSNDPVTSQDGNPANPVTGEYTLPEFSYEEMLMACSEAQNLGKRCAIHCMGKTQLKNAINTGPDTIEHGIYLDDELCELMGDKEITLVPTLSGYRETMNPIYSRGSRWVDLHRHLPRPHFNSVQVAVRSGVQIAVGTDSTGDYVDEMELLVEAGLSPMDAILSATAIPAEVLGLSTMIGTIEEGKIADIIVVDGNPLQDIQALRKIEYIFQDGVGSTPSEIAVSDADETYETRSLSDVVE